MKSIVYLILSFLLVSFAGISFVQAQQPRSSLEIFLEDRYGIPSDARSYYAHEEWKIVQYLLNTKAHIAESIYLKKKDKDEIVSFLDNEIVWFERHINALLELNDIQDLPVHLARGRERYEMYPRYIDTIRERIALSKFAKMHADLDEIHNDILRQTIIKQSQGYDVAELFNILDTADTFIVQAADVLEDRNLSTETIRVLATETVSKGLAAEKQAYSLLQSL